MRKDAEVGAELVALVCCDLGAIVRGRAVSAEQLEESLRVGVGWVPANHSLTPHGPLAEHTPFDSTGDLRLLGDAETHVRMEGRLGGDTGSDPCGWRGTRGRRERAGVRAVRHRGDRREAVGVLPAALLARGARGARAGVGARVVASFEHEFQLLAAAPPTTRASSREEPPRAPAASPPEEPPAAPFSLEALRRVEPFAAEAMGALAQAGAQPERIFAEFAAHQFEVPVAPAVGVGAADRGVVLREVVREVARRREAARDVHPAADPAGPGNGAHIHLDLRDAAGAPLLYDATRAGHLSELGGRFAAGILRHAGALSALTAPSPVSAARLTPHRWSAGAVCVGERNRETLLRIPPLVALGGADPAISCTWSTGGRTRSANPYLALGALLRAGLEGVREGLPAPPILDRDPTRLDAGEAERYGVGALPGSLDDALGALAEDDTARGWLGETLYEAYVGIKRAELAAVADLDVGGVCERYARIY